MKIAIGVLSFADGYGRLNSATESSVLIIRHLAVKCTRKRALFFFFFFEQYFEQYLLRLDILSLC